MLERYLRRLYERTMREAYGSAYLEVAAALAGGGRCLDCGAGQGQHFLHLQQDIDLTRERYEGIEWHPGSVQQAQAAGIPVRAGDLNMPLPFADASFRCVFGFSVLEHLLRGCHWLREAHRVLEPGGSLVLVTPNVATWFTAALIVLGRMPSVGPHPDDPLLKEADACPLCRSSFTPDLEGDTPLHRHLVVFSYRALRRYLVLCGFADVYAHAFGLYPFPAILQPLLERLDPWHCHQLVFRARKRPLAVSA